MAANLSYFGVTPHLKNLRLCGFYQLDSNSSKIRRILHTAYMRLILFFILLYACQQVVKVYQLRDDVDRAMGTMFLMLTHTDSIYKQIVLLKKANRIEELLAVMRGPIFNQEKSEHEEYLLGAARQARLLLQAFNIAALSTCLLWVIYPIILFVQRKPVEFAIWLPFDANLSPQFYFVVLYVWLQTSWLAYGNTTMDVFITFFLAQSKTQLFILRMDLENIVEKSKEDAEEESIDFKTVLEQRFKEVLIHYAEIVKVAADLKKRKQYRLCARLDDLLSTCPFWRYATDAQRIFHQIYGDPKSIGLAEYFTLTSDVHKRFSGAIQNIFGGAILYQFLVSGWIICTTAYRTVNMDPLSVEFVSMVMYMFCILIQLFMYCFYGNEVTYESEKLIESAYAMKWPEIPIKYQRALIIFMERIKCTIKPVAGILIPLSMSTFISVLRSSYTFYAFLKNTN